MSDTPAQPSPVRVLLADDSALVRKGVATLLASSRRRPIQVAAEVARAAEVVDACLQHRPDVVLLDVRFPDGSGLDACRQLTQRMPGARVIILTSYSNDGFIYDAITAGAHGYLMKEIDPEGLVRAVIEVAEGRSILDPETTARVMHMMRSSASMGQGGDPLSSLSAQERRVLALVSEGRTNKEIGDALALSDNTVKNYLGTVFEKLNVKRRSQAAALWVQANQPRNQG